MKLLQRIKNRGIAMTEYLIILAIVAIAAIAIIGLFGKQIKSVFVKGTDALQGTASDTSGDAKVKGSTDAKQDNFKTFDNKTTQNQ